MKPLSIILQIKSNIKRLMPTIITIALEIAAVTFMISIGISVIYSAEYNLGYYTERMLCINFNSELSDTSLENIKNKIGKIDNVVMVSEGDLTNSTAMMPIMYSGTPFIKIEQEEVERFINNSNVKLIKGSYPKENGEILITNELANMLKVDLLDYIGKDYDDKSRLDNNYKVVGIIKGNNSFYLATFNNSKDMRNLIVQVNPGTTLKVKNKIEDLGLENISVIDFEGIGDFIENTKGVLKRLGGVAIGIFSMVILITVINLSKSIISNFNEEYSLLKALGYKNKSIKRRICGQLAFILVAATILGIIGGVLTNILYNSIFCIQKGIPFINFNIVMLIPVFIVAIIFLLTALNINKKVVKMEFMGETSL